MDETRYRARLIARCILMAAISIPLIFKVVPPNVLYGFRTAEALRSRDVWYSANAFAGWALLVSSAIAAGLLFVLPPTTRRWQLLASVVVPVAGAFIASLEYVARLH